MAEIWYNNENVINKVDLLRYKFIQDKNDSAYFLENLFTILIDLSMNEDEIFSLFKKNTKYEINRAINKDNIKCGILLDYGSDNIEKINEYINYYNDFAKSKKRSLIKIDDIQQFINMKNICIRYAKKDDEVLSMHAYVISDNIVRLHQSCSLFRNSNDIEYKNMVARANRLLHWDDILFFKQKGILLYDLGGWYGGKTNEEQLLINKFKESFGGKIKQEYSYIIPVSILGFISIFYRFIIKR